MLLIHSSDIILALGACHEGAAIEGLCLTGEKQSDPAHSYTTFYHATSPDQPAVDNAGILYWNLTVNLNQTVPSAMRFSTDVTSNLAIPILMPGNSTYTTVYFTDGGCMYIPRAIDDTVSPPTYISPPQKLENWYICLTRYGYLYTTLTWKIGVTGTPQNPSCQKAQIQRVFI